MELSVIYEKCPQFLRDYLTYISVIGGRSDNTVKQYYYDLRMFLRFIMVCDCPKLKEDFKNIDISEFEFERLKKIKLQDLYTYMAYIHNEHSSNDNFKARKIVCLRSFFNHFAGKEKLLDENPAQHLELPKIKKRMPKYLSVEQSIDFLKSIDGEYKSRDFAIFAVFLSCGLRLSELVGIDMRKLNLAEKKLTVIGKGNKERIVYLNDLCVESIKIYLNERPVDGILQKDRDALFISNKLRRITGRMVEILAKKYFDKAGIDSTVYTPHKLRHTFATIMYRDGGVDIRILQELLGHTNLSTTQIYTHVKDDDIKDAAARHPLANMKIE